MTGILGKESVNASPSFQISNDEVHVWSASLEQSAQNMAWFSSLLSVDERERSQRFYFEKDKKHFIVGRGILRILLGKYLGAEPAQIEFSYGTFGKPALGNTLHKNNLQFNLSHSNDKALYAFTLNQQIGVDIEHLRPMKDMNNFALQFFTPNECKLIYSLSNNQKQEAFFKLWTCKEAFLKANGSGLTIPINEVEVVLASDGTANLTSIGINKKEAAHWHLKLFTPYEGYQGCVAIKGNEKQITFQKFDHQ